MVSTSNNQADVKKDLSLQQMGMFSLSKQCPLQEYFVYFKKDLRSTKEKDPLLIGKDFFMFAKNKKADAQHPHIHTIIPPKGKWNINPFAFAEGEADSEPSLLLGYLITGFTECQALFSKQKHPGSCGRQEPGCFAF